MGKMGIESVEKKPDYRVIEITRTGTYKAVSNIAVAEDKLVIVALDKTDPNKVQIKEYDGTTGDIIVGVIKENAVAGTNSVVIKRGKLNIEALDMTNISGLEGYEVIELLEQQNLFTEKLSERQNF
ncbi:MAG: hypothetical protein KBF12_10610 [Sebaldella sp.]|nr:hypothetical protein [Sebaldella sp.]